jgi:hypothetical protein
MRVAWHAAQFLPTSDTCSVPEPSPLVLFGVGAIGLIAWM